MVSCGRNGSLLRLWSSTATTDHSSCCGNIWSQGPSSLVEVKKWGFIFLQRPFIYLSHTPNFLPPLSGASVAISSPHQLLSPVRTHKDAPSVGTERVPTARLLSLLSFIRWRCSRAPPARHCRDLTDSSASAGPPSRRRCHSLDSMAGFISHAAKRHLNHQISPQSLSVKDFLTRPNSHTSSAGGGVIFSHFAQQAYVVHLLILHFLLCAWFICCSCWTGWGELDVRFNEIWPLQIWRNLIYGSRMCRFNTRWACVQTHFQANTCEYWAEFHRGTTAALKQTFQKCSVGMRAVRNVLRGAKGAAVA